MNIRERLGKELLFLDGGMGTLLQAEGLAPGELPETWNIEHPEKVEAIHRRYYEAGSDVVLANTFGANVCKFHDDRYTVEEVIRAGIANAKRAGEQIGKETYVALDMGPTGKLLKPMGDLDFDDAYEAFAEAVRYGEKYGADLIHIETMSDTYEVKAAILAAKENSSLPVFVTMIFDERGKLLTGGDVPSVVAMLEGLRVDALGLNCGLGPKQMLPILNDLRRYTSLPIIVKPNAGLPKQKNGETYYDVEPDEFARIMQEVVKEGACVIGGCCGTTPEHIKKLVEECRRHVRVLERFNGDQPSHYLNEISMRHWDGYWFGKCMIYGDTLPHSASVHTSDAFLHYARISGDETYRKRAVRGARNVLSLFRADGSASTSYLYPLTCNGTRCEFYDYFANEQDGYLYFLIKFFGALGGNEALNKKRNRDLQKYIKYITAHKPRVFEKKPRLVWYIYIFRQKLIFPANTCTRKTARNPGRCRGDRTFRRARRSLQTDTASRSLPCRRA